MISRRLQYQQLQMLYRSVRLESISVGSVRAGMILKLDGQHVEVKKYEPKREGRGGAMGAVRILFGFYIESSLDRICRSSNIEDW